MYELLVLSLLMHWPLHAYLIAKISNDIIGPWEKISRGTLSSLLTKLEQAGLITPADPAKVPFQTDRPSRAFMITPSGCERFYQLMMDTTSHPGTYQRLFYIKVLHLEFLKPEDQLFLVDSYLHYCQMVIHNEQDEAEEFTRNPIKQEHTSSALRETVLDLMRLKAEQWQLEVAWVKALRQRVISRMKQHENPVPDSL